jgi:hypothetical protein
MQELILYIKPKVVAANQTTQKFQRVDLMEAELITLTQVIQDVKEIDKIFTDFSRTFNLPASKVNNKIFQHWYNDDVIGFDNHIMSDAIIELNHLPFKIGQIKLESVVMKNNKPSMYKVTFFGNTVSLNNLIGDDQIEDLDWLSNFDYISNNTNIQSGFENGLDVTVDSVAYVDAIIYPLISVEHSYFYNSTIAALTAGNIAVSGTGSSSIEFGVFADDLKPAIKVSLILKAIEQQYGLTFKTGEFFDSTVFTNMYLWLHREKGIISESVNSTILIGSHTGTFSCSTTSGVSGQDSCAFFGVGATGNGYAEIQSNQYVIKKVSTHFKNVFEVKIIPESGFSNLYYTLDIVDTLTGEVLKTSNGNGTRTSQLVLDRVGSELQIGEEKRLAARITCAQNFQFKPEFEFSVFEGTTYNPSLSVLYRAKLSSYTDVFQTVDNELQIRNNLPKIGVLNFLKGLFKMHNLTAFVNDSNEIVVKTLDSFYSGGDTIDISKYVVTDQHTIEANLPFTEIDFQYPEPKTILAQQYLQTNNQRFGELEFKSNASDEKKYLVEAPFEHMMFERLNDLATSNQTDIQYGLFSDDDLNASIGAPLLFYGINRQSISNSIYYRQGSRKDAGIISSAVLTNYWMPSNYNELGTSSTPPSFNLNFGSEINEYTLTDYGGVNNSLFEKYYTNYITRVFKIKTRLYKLKAILPLKELIKISLDDKIIVGTRAFTINKMTTKLQSGETELELLSEPE